MKYLKLHWRTAAAGAISLVCVIILILAILIPDGASPAYIYTIHWLVNFILPPCIVILVILFAARGRRKLRNNIFISLALLLFGFCLLAIIHITQGRVFSANIREIALSLCWIGSFLSIGLSLFFMGAASKAVPAAILCSAGSIGLALAGAEAFLLATPQPQDGRYFNDVSSKYVAAGQAMAGEINIGDGVCGRGVIPRGKPVSTAHRYMRYDEEIYDARYDFDIIGRRAMPKAEVPPEYDLLLFGCSYTFGWGLNNEQTWAWQLARELGPRWHVANYAFNGFSANQMLCMLENDLIEMPTAPHRYALFLAIRDHIRRNEFFAHYPHYMLEANNAVRSGQGRYLWLSNFPSRFVGSQLARHVSVVGGGMAAEANMAEAEKLYVAMIKQANSLLKQKYGTELIVMLWPDLEHLAPILASYGIRTVMARPMLPLWDTDRAAYAIHQYDDHPNARAAETLADGLAAYFARVAKQ